MYTFVYRTFIKFIFFCWGQALDAPIAAPIAIGRQAAIKHTFQHTTNVIKRIKANLRSNLLGWHFVRGSEKGRLSLQFKLQDSYPLKTRHILAVYPARTPS